MARLYLIGDQRLRQIALRHLHVADLFVEYDRPPCQSALPGSAFARRSMMARLA